MAENRNNALGNALSAANAVRGAVKTGKAIAAAAKGGAAGGAVGAAAAFAVENRRLIAAAIIGLTAKTIILCLTALPIGVLGLAGINGESLSSFIFGFLKFLKNRRVLKIGDDRKNSVSEYLPIEKIENGIIYTKDKRYIKVIEVLPINFLLRSAREQRSIIYSLIFI